MDERTALKKKKPELWAFPVSLFLLLAYTFLANVVVYAHGAESGNETPHPAAAKESVKSRVDEQHQALRKKGNDSEKPYKSLDAMSRAVQLEKERSPGRAQGGVEIVPKGKGQETSQRRLQSARTLSREDHSQGERRFPEVGRLLASHGKHGTEGKFQQRGRRNLPSDVNGKTLLHPLVEKRRLAVENAAVENVTGVHSRGTSRSERSQSCTGTERPVSSAGNLNAHIASPSVAKDVESPEYHEQRSSTEEAARRQEKQDARCCQQATEGAFNAQVVNTRRGNGKASLSKQQTRKSGLAMLQQTHACITETGGKVPRYYGAAGRVDLKDKREKAARVGTLEKRFLHTSSNRAARSKPESSVKVEHDESIAPGVAFSMSTGALASDEFTNNIVASVPSTPHLHPSCSTGDCAEQRRQCFPLPVRRKQSVSVPTLISTKGTLTLLKKRSLESNYSAPDTPDEEIWKMMDSPNRSRNRRAVHSCTASTILLDDTTEKDSPTQRVKDTGRTTDSSFPCFSTVITTSEESRSILRSWLAKWLPSSVQPPRQNKSNVLLLRVTAESLSCGERETRENVVGHPCWKGQETPGDSTESAATFKKGKALPLVAETSETASGRCSKGVASLTAEKTTTEPLFIPCTQEESASFNGALELTPEESRVSVQHANASSALPGWDAPFTVWSAHTNSLPNSVPSVRKTGEHLRKEVHAGRLEKAYSIFERKSEVGTAADAVHSWRQRWRRLRRANRLSPEHTKGPNEHVLSGALGCITEVAPAGIREELPSVVVRTQKSEYDEEAPSELNMHPLAQHGKDRPSRASSVPDEEDFPPQVKLLMKSRRPAPALQKDLAVDARSNIQADDGTTGPLCSFSQDRTFKTADSGTSQSPSKPSRLSASRLLAGFPVEDCTSSRDHGAKKDRLAINLSPAGGTLVQEAQFARDPLKHPVHHAKGARKVSQSDAVERLEGIYNVGRKRRGSPKKEGGVSRMKRNTPVPSEFCLVTPKRSPAEARPVSTADVVAGLRPMAGTNEISTTSRDFAYWGRSAAGFAAQAKAEDAANEGSLDNSEGTREGVPRGSAQGVSPREGLEVFEEEDRLRKLVAGRLLFLRHGCSQSSIESCNTPPLLGTRKRLQGAISRGFCWVSRRLRNCGVELPFSASSSSDTDSVGTVSTSSVWPLPTSAIDGDTPAYDCMGSGSNDEGLLSRARREMKKGVWTLPLKINVERTARRPFKGSRKSYNRRK